jgi:Flp pilus assembly protein TadG
MYVRGLSPGRERSGERGSIIIMTAIGMLIMILMVGLTIDVSRIYMVRSELQNAADAAALTAARELNSGALGIDAAVTSANSIVNSRANGARVVSIGSVEFAETLDGTYMNATSAKAPGTVANIRFVKVTTQSTSTNILFALKAIGEPHVESRKAVAGMSVSINTICDFFPVTVALNPAVEPGDDPLTGYPAPNTTMTLTYKQGDPSGNVLANKNYILVNVPEISGGGERETVELAAGVANLCQTLNVNIPLHITKSANKTNGPKAIGWGANSRFDDPGKNYIDPATYPPDTNIKEGITFDQYLKKNPLTSPSHAGENERRILIVVIVNPGTYNAVPGPPTARFGAFFLKNKIPNSADLTVEWIDETLVIGRGSYTPCVGTTSSTLTLPVLYK